MSRHGFCASRALSITSRSEHKQEASAPVSVSLASVTPANPTTATANRQRNPKGQRAPRLQSEATRHTHHYSSGESPLASRATISERPYRRVLQNHRYNSEAPHDSKGEVAEDSRDIGTQCQCGPRPYWTRSTGMARGLGGRPKPLAGGIENCLPLNAGERMSMVVGRST